MANLKARALDGVEIDEVLDGGDVRSLEVGSGHASAGMLQARRIEFGLDGLA